jgi:hypothetical protein
VTFVDLAQLADLFGVEIFLAGSVPEHVLDMERIAVGCLQNFSSIELGIDDVQRIVLEEIVDELYGYALRQRLEFDLCEGGPDTLEEEIFLHLNDSSADEGNVQEGFQEFLLSGRDPIEVVKEDQIGLV